MLCLFSANVSAAPIDVEQARQVVENFRKKATRGGMRRAPMAKGRLNHCYTKRTQAGNPAVYAFTNEGGGFALVAADDAVASVLGYSDTGTFDPDNIPDGLQYLLDEYAKEIAAAGPRKANEQLPEPPYEVEETEQLGPLLETKWGQMRPYNLQSPLSIVGNAATGCMTTAIAQIMRYHKWPEQGYGSCEFNVSEGYNTIFTVRDYYTRHYNWDVMYPHTSQYTMRDAKNYDTNAEDVASVSQLMFDIGVGLSTDYTISGVSSAVEVRIIPMLTSYFNYDPGLEFVTLSKTTPEAFNHMLIEELQASRPVYLQGGPLGYGHAFVCDGYNGQGHFHINWGWEGKSDGYYLITGLTPAQQGTGGGSSSGYSENLKMLRHIMPYDGVAPRPQFKINRYSVEADANGNYLAAQFGVTKDRNIRGQLGVLVIDTEGNGKLFWDKDGGYTQINTAGTEGAYYDFHVNVDPSWTAPGTRVYYIYKECGDPQWRYVKDGGNNYCCIKFGLSGGNIVAEHNTSEPNYTGTPGNYYLNDDYEYALGNKITSLSQIQSGHVYAIARHNGPGFASINPSGGVLQGRTTFDTQGTTAFVFTGNTTAGYTIKSAVANAYLPVLTTTDSNGNVVSLGWGQEKFAIEDFNGDITDGLQIKSLGSSYGSGKVYLHCTGTTNNFLGWHGYSGGDSQMDIYEVTVNGQHTMPGTSEKLVVTYNIFLGNKKIGTQVYEETVGQAPTKDFVPYFVTAEDFPQTITGDVTAYDIHTSYNDKLPVDPSQYFNIGFTQGTTTYWWYNTGDGNGYCKESTTTPSATDKTAQWTFVGDWLNGFVVKNANQGKIVWARDVVNNSPIFLAVDQALDDKTFLLEHRDAGFYLHLKGRTMYLTHQSSNNVSINNTLNNAANLLTFAVPGEDPTTPDTPVDVTYTVNVVGAPAGASVAVTVKGETVVGNTVTLSSSVSATDVSSTDISGYAYSVKVNGTTITVTYTLVPYVVGKKYVIKSVAHTTTGKTYYILPPASGTKCEITETAPTSEDDVWTVASITPQTDGSYNVSFKNGSKYFAFLATTTTANHVVRLSRTDVDATNYWNIQDNLNYWPDKSNDTRFLFLAVKDDYATSSTIGWGSIQNGNKIRSTGYSYQFQIDEFIGQAPMTYTVNVVGAPTGQTVTVTVKGQTVTGTSVTLDSTVSATDVSATAISGYTYSVEVNGTTITVTYESDNTPTGPDFTVPGTYYVYIQKGTKYLHNDRLNNISNTTEEVEVQSLNTEDNGFVWRLTTHGTTYDLVNGQGFGYKQYATSSEQKTLTSIPDTWTLTEIPESKIWNVVVEGSEYGCVTRGDYCVAWDGGFFVTDMTASADAFAAGEVDGCTAAPLSITDGTSAATITVTYTPNGLSQDILDLIEEVKAANVKMQTGTVGYPLIADLNRSDTDLAAYFTFLDAQGDLPDATPEFYEELRASFEHLAATYTDVKMPEAGHAYKISVRSNDGNTHWYIKNNGKITTNADEAAIFVMGGSGNEDFSAIFVSNDNGNSHYLRSRGADAVNYVADKCDFRLTPMTKVSSSFITVNVLRRFGTFSFRPKSDVMMGGQYPMTLDESNLDWAFATKEVMGEACTSAIEMTEVEYPYTKPKLVAGDNGSFASIWLPFPMIFPEGVEVYKGTQEHGADGEAFLGLERVDTNRAVAAGGYILYSETLTGEIEVQPVAGTPADKHNTSDAAFFGSTEPNYTWSEFTTAHPGTPYVLANKDKGIGFYKYVGTTLPKGKAIWMDPNGTASTVKFNFDDVITALDALHGHQSPFKEDLEGLYDLQGHRLDKVQKGQVNVINGKKIMFK